MQVSVLLEHRFCSTPDGKVYTQTMFPYSFWQRYLEVFEKVNIIARIQNVEIKSNNWLRADGYKVSFSPVPYYLGPFQYLLSSKKVKQAVRNGVNVKDAVILRVGSNVANCLEKILYQTNRPYGVEVVCDPYDVFAPGAVRHPFRFFFRWWSPLKLRRQCRRASAAAYVTKEALQKRYPPSENAYKTYYSDVELPSEAFSITPREQINQNLLKLIHVGSMGHFFKAQDVLLKAMKICLSKTPGLKLVFIGDGKHKNELQNLAKKMKIENNVEFKGQLSAGEEVRKELDEADLFVLPSRQEGLPRAIIEAMARGLPCVASTVGGIPELLLNDDLVPPDDSFALANKICEVVRNPERMKKMAARNWKKAHEYKDDCLKERRCNCYLELRAQMKRWIFDQGLN